MVMTLTLALVATVLIEYGVLLFLRERRRKVLWASVCINILTNVPLNLYLRYIDGSIMSLTIGELLVVAIEAMGYFCLTKRIRLSLIYSTLCNAISFFTGLLFQLSYALYSY